MPALKTLPFSGRINRFISHYVNHEDLRKAATLSGLQVEEAERIYKRKEVRAEIDKRLNVVHNQQAKLIAKYKTVEVNFLDDQLVRTIKRAGERGDAKALIVGYQRLGMFRDGEFIGAPKAVDPGGAGSQDRPMIFRAVERTVTRTEQVTERAELTEGEPQGQLLPPAPVLQY